MVPAMGLSPLIASVSRFSVPRVPWRLPRLPMVIGWMGIPRRLIPTGRAADVELFTRRRAGFSWPWRLVSMTPDVEAAGGILPRSGRGGQAAGEVVLNGRGVRARLGRQAVRPRRRKHPRRRRTGA